MDTISSSKVEALEVAYFLGALGAWLKQLERVSCLSQETIKILSLGITAALDELKALRKNG